MLFKTRFLRQSSVRIWPRNRRPRSAAIVMCAAKHQQSVCPADAQLCSHLEARRPSSSHGRQNDTSHSPQPPSCLVATSLFWPHPSAVKYHPPALLLAISWRYCEPCRNMPPPPAKTALCSLAHTRPVRHASMASMTTTQPHR
jgi:hypothetical protein